MSNSHLPPTIFLADKYTESLHKTTGMHAGSLQNLALVLDDVILYQPAKEEVGVGKCCSQQLPEVPCISAAVMVNTAICGCNTFAAADFLQLPCHEILSFLQTLHLHTPPYTPQLQNHWHKSILKAMPSKIPSAFQTAFKPARLHLSM